ncbi:hypothetical protein DSECCO2_220090 [anaerobic digester metagenome]
MGQIFHGKLRVALVQQNLQLRAQLRTLALQKRHPLIVWLRAVIGGQLLQHGVFLFIVLQLPLNLHAAGDVRVFQIQIGTGLVNQVDGLVRQETVRNIPLGEQHRLTQNAVAEFHAVERLILRSKPLQNLDGILDRRLVHRHRLEAPLQRRVLFDGLAVLGKGGGSNHLNLAPGKGGLQNVGGIHAALRIPRAHDGVNLVDHEDDVPQPLYFVNQALHPGLKLATELRTRHQGGQVQQIDLLLPQLKGNLPRGNALGQALGNGGLANARLADQAGIVLLAAIQNLDHPLNLLFPADHRVQLAVFGPLRQIQAIALQILALFVALVFLVPVRPGRTALGLLIVPGRGVAIEQTVQKREGGSFALFLIRVRIFLLGQILHVLHAVKRLKHLIVQRVQIVVGDPHPLHHIVHLRQAQFLRALQAQALVHGVLAVQPGDEHHGHIFFAS